MPSNTHPAHTMDEPLLDVVSSAHTDLDVGPAQGGDAVGDGNGRNGGHDDDTQEEAPKVAEESAALASSPSSRSRAMARTIARKIFAAAWPNSTVVLARSAITMTDVAVLGCVALTLCLRRWAMRGGVC